MGAVMTTVKKKKKKKRKRKARSRISGATLTEMIEEATVECVAPRRCPLRGSLFGDDVR